MRKFYWMMLTKDRWLQNKIQLSSTSVFINSSAGKSLSQNKQVSARNKRIDLKYRFVDLAIGSNFIVLEDVVFVENQSDMLTKILYLPTPEHVSKIIRIS